MADEAPPPLLLPDQEFEQIKPAPKRRSKPPAGPGGKRSAKARKGPSPVSPIQSLSTLSDPTIQPVPIFTPQFLACCRNRESELRKLRARNIELEKEASLALSETQILRSGIARFEVTLTSLRNARDVITSITSSVLKEVGHDGSDFDKAIDALKSKSTVEKDAIAGKVLQNYL